MTAAPPLRYDASVILAVPVVADRDLMDLLHDAYRQMDPGAYADYARSCGVNPPTNDGVWLIGTQPHSGGVERLVWYQPAKLQHIQQLAAHAAAAQPDAEELLVVQGHGWDDYAVVVAASESPDRRDLQFRP